MKKLLAMALVLSMVLSMVPAVFAAENVLADLAVVNPTVDYQTNPIGIEETDVKFAWAMESNAIGASQLNYQIVVREGSVDGEIVWDTGVVEDSRSTAVIYGGEALEAEGRYYWDVTITDQNGTTASSEGNWFELAPTMEDATWIMYGQNDQPAPLFRTEITLDKEVAKASLSLSAMGIYDAYINGEEVKSDVDDIFNPGLTNYATHVYYQTYDVTDMLVKGANAIGVMVGGGWYQTAYSANYQGTFGPDDKAEERALLGKLVVTYTDGTKAVFTTNSETWKASQNSPVVYDDQWNGETQDGRIAAAIEGWNEVGFDTTDWVAPVAEVYEGKLMADARATAFINPAYEQKPIYAYTYNDSETSAAYRVNENEWYYGGVVEHPVDHEKDIALKTGDVLILDLGQNMVGFNSITVSGPAGATVTMRHAEMLNDGKDVDYFLDQGGKNGNTGSDDPEGTLYLTALRGALATDKYIMTGAGKEVFQPYFTFHGYRYVEITADADITLHGLRGLVVSSVGEEIGLLETSNADVNQLISNTKWGQMGNYLSIPTDCPQRNERAGWTGDAQLFAATAVMNFDVNTFMEKYIDDMNSFFEAYGFYANVMPKVVSSASLPNCGWSDAGVIIPWVMYKQTGDIRIIETAYPYMAEYTRDVAATGYNTRMYGDWLAPWPASLAFCSGAYELYINYLMTDMAELLGNEEDVKYFADHAEVVRQRMIAKYVDEEGNLLTKTADNASSGMDNAQTGLLWALKLGMYNDEETRQTFINNLLTNIRNENKSIRPDGAENSLSVGFLGVNVLLPVLSDIGETETAYALLLQDENPSWLYSVKQGATTIWERWNGYSLENSFGPSSMNSFNHYSYGACLEWMYNYMVGIKDDINNPGYKHFILQPTVDAEGRITFANGSYKSLYGNIVSNWNSVDGEIAFYEATVPANTSATLYLPVSDKDVVLPAELIGLVDVVGEVVNNGEPAIQMELPAGSYSFTFTKNTVEVAIADENLVVPGVEVALIDNNAGASISDEALTYTVSVSDAIQLATANLTFEVEGEATVEGLNGWNVIAQSCEKGVVTATLFNVAGLTGAGNIAELTVATPEKPGTVTVELTKAVLSAYVGESEAFIDAVLGDVVAQTYVDYNNCDVNRDGIVDQLDITRAQRLFGAENTTERADVDKNGTVDIADLIMILNNYTVFTVAGDEFVNYLHEEYDEPELIYAPEVRWWMAEGSHTDETLMEEINTIADAGFGAVEFLAMNVFGSNSTKYGWGSEEWINDTKMIIKEATEKGLGFSLTSGTNWGNANLPDTYTYNGELITPDHPSTGKQLSNATAAVAAGQKLEADLMHRDFASRGVTKYELVNVVAVGMLDSKNLDPNDTILLTAGEDYTEIEGGIHVNWTAPETNENYTVFAFWMHGHGATANPSVSTNYALNYIDAAGMEALMAYWDEYILTDDMRALIKENGRGELYMDSLEVSGISGTGGMLWGYEFLEEFEARRGYSFLPYMPFLLNSTSGSTFLFSDMKFTYNTLQSDGWAADDQITKIRNDYYQTMTELYMENVLQPLQEWLHSIGMSLRAEVSYGGHFYENTQPTKYVDGIETESLEFGSQIDSYRNFSGAAHLYNKVYSCEMGAMTGMLYDGTVDRMNQIMYTGFAAGISRNVLHTWSSQWAPTEKDAAWPGYKGSNWPERVGPRQPVFQHYNEWTTMLSRYQKALRQGAPRMDVAILRTDYRLINNLFNYTDKSGFRVGDGLYYDISLQYAGYTYDYFSPMLLTEPEVDFEDGVIQPEGPAYQALIIYQEELPLETAEIVLEWAKEGLPVLLVNGVNNIGKPGMYHEEAAIRTLFNVAGNPDAEAELAEVMAELRTLDNVIEIDDATETVASLETLGVTPRAQFSEANDKLLTYMRQDAENDVNYLYVYNYEFGETNLRNDIAIRDPYTVEIAVEGEGKPYVIDAWTGDVSAVETYRIEDGKTVLTVTLVPGQPALYAINTADTATLHAVESDVEVINENGALLVKAMETGNYTVELSNNRTAKGSVVVPEDIDLTFDVAIETWTKGDLVTRTEKKEAYEHTTTEYKYETVKTMKELGVVEELKAWKEMGVAESGVGYYTATFELPAGWNADNGAVLTLGSIYRSSAMVYVNGNRVVIPLETLKLDITDYLVEGENEIIVEVASNLQNSVGGKTAQNYGLVGECFIDTYTLKTIG